MSLFIRQLLPALILTCFFQDLVFASVISLDTTCETNLDQTQKIINLSFQLTNNGDEAAHEVSIELPFLKESYQVTSTLSLKQPVIKSLDISFSKLGLINPGTYIIPFRIHYKDANFYSFSSPGIARVILPPAPEVVILGSSEALKKGVPIKLNESAEFKATFQNITNETLTIDSLQALSATEIGSTFDSPQLPIKLNSLDKIPLKIQLTNRSALIGSTYANYLIASGTTRDKHFAELLTFTVEITDSSYNPRMIFSILLFSLAGILILGWLKIKLSSNR